jgi:hypothetical protein
MKNLFVGRGRDGRVTLHPMARSRWARWRRQFERGEGPPFYAAAVLAALGCFIVLWAALALGSIAGL